MSSLILVTCDSGAGHLKRKQRADRILTFMHRLVTGPVPTGGQNETFFQRQRALYEAEGLFHEPWWFEAEDVDGMKPQYKRIWSRLPAVCLDYDRVELWIDPDPNAQLLLLQLLDWLGHIPEIPPRLWLKQSESPLGERRPGDWASPPGAVGSMQVALASRAWAAFGASKPEAWEALSRDPDLDALPGLGSTVERMLNELPDLSGLGATERRSLGVTERQGWWDEARHGGVDASTYRLTEQERGPLRVIQRTQQFGGRLPLSYFEIGERLCELAAAPVPAIAGVTERHFTLDIHMDENRFRPFRESPLSLTDFGRRLVAGADDWSLHNPIHHWWGGTRLTNENLWRWNPAQRQLLRPGD